MVCVGRHATVCAYAVTAGYTLYVEIRIVKHKRFPFQTTGFLTYQRFNKLTHSNPSFQHNPLHAGKNRLPDDGKKRLGGKAGGAYAGGF